MADSQMNNLITGFIFMIIAVIFVGILAGSAVDTWSKTISTDETMDISTARVGLSEINITSPANDFTVANPPTGYKQVECPIESVTLTNDTGTVFTLTTDYTVADSTGIITILNSTAMQNSLTNTTLVDYTYCSDNYVTLSWGRTAITVTYGLFAIGALGIALWFFYSIFKETGLA